MTAYILKSGSFKFPRGGQIFVIQYIVSCVSRVSFGGHSLPLGKYFSSRTQGTYRHNNQPHVHLPTMGCPTSAVKNGLTVRKSWSRYTEMTMEFPVSIFRKETVDKIVLEFGSVLPPPLRTSRGTILLAKKIRSLSESV